MSPFEHGEVFVLDDGGEVFFSSLIFIFYFFCFVAKEWLRISFKVDLDLGNYERFLDVTLTKDNNITTGKIYQVGTDFDVVAVYFGLTFSLFHQSVLDKERKGDYLGKTVQVKSEIMFQIFVIGLPSSFFLFFFLKVVPHITDAIKDWIESVSLIPVDGKEGQADVCVIELGGTVGKSYLRFHFTYTVSKDPPYLDILDR